MGAFGEKEFLEAVAKNQNIIHKVCRLFTSDRDDHSDLFQEITIKLWLGYGSYKGDSSFTTWMYRVALNTAISMKRKSKLYQNTQPLTPNLDAAEEDNSFGDQEIAMLYRAIEELDPVEKALMLLYLEEKQYQEIADIMGITKTHVGVKLVRTKKKLEIIMRKMNQ
ncbi:MAG TPA: RNA polymerase subunit sigma-70 [Bacteroidales bacterium]|nr:RNA polymerase subunit sigma-70 [Bacteroidales bacterium]